MRLFVCSKHLCEHLYEDLYEHRCEHIYEDLYGSLTHSDASPLWAADQQVHHLCDHIYDHLRALKLWSE